MYIDFRRKHDGIGAYNAEIMPEVKTTILQAYQMEYMLTKGGIQIQVNDDMRKTVAEAAR